MTFASEVTRILFNQLPIDKQRKFCDFEDRLAKDGSGVQIDGIMVQDNLLEIIVRVTEEFKPSMTWTNCAESE